MCIRIIKKNQSFSVNEQLRFYSAELWSLVLINNILEQSQQQNQQLSDWSSVNFESLFTNLISINRSILSNVSKSIEAKHGCISFINFHLVYLCPVHIYYVPWHKKVVPMVQYIQYFTSLNVLLSYPTITVQTIHECP